MMWGVINNTNPNGNKDSPGSVLTVKYEAFRRDFNATAMQVYAFLLGGGLPSEQLPRLLDRVQGFNKFSGERGKEVHGLITAERKAYEKIWKDTEDRDLVMAAVARETARYRSLGAVRGAVPRII